MEQVNLGSGISFTLGNRDEVDGMIVSLETSHTLCDMKGKICG